MLYQKNLPKLKKDKDEVEKDNRVKRLLKKDFKGVNTDLKIIEKIKKSLGLFEKQFCEKTIQEFLKNQNSLKNIISIAKKMEKNNKDLDDTYGSIKDHIESSFFDKDFYGTPIEELTKRFKKLDPKLLDDWISFLNVKKDNSSFENNILDCFEKNELKYENLSGIFKALYYNSLLKKVYEEYP